MVHTTGFIWGQHVADAYKRRATGEGPTSRERKLTRVSCKEYGGEMAQLSIRRHMERSHGIVLPHIRGADVRGAGLETYKVSFPRILKSVGCLVEGCLPRENTPRRLWDHFMYLHWKLKVDIMQEGPEPILRCDQCWMHMMASRIFTHIHTAKCNKENQRKLRRRDVDMTARCGDMEFSLEGEEGDKIVEGVVMFKYPGRNLDQTDADDDWSEVRKKIMRTR